MLEEPARDVVTLHFIDSLKPREFVFDAALELRTEFAVEVYWLWLEKVASDATSLPALRRCMAHA